jgi:hypothetical protein
MTLREFIRLLGYYFDRSVDSISNFFSNLWNRILDAPIWVLVIIGFVIAGGWGLHVDFRKRKEEAERKRIQKLAKEFWKDAATKDNKESE